MRILSVRLDEQTDALLRAYCARTGATQTEAIKSGIAALSGQSVSPAELAESLDLVGCFNSDEGDLGRDHSRHLREKLAGRFRRG